MIKNQLVILLSFLFLCLFSCVASENEQLKKLHTEVISIHDEIMPRKGEVNRLKRQLNSYYKIVSLENVKLKDSLNNCILILSKSEDLMMDWMANFKYPNEKMSSEQMIQYLSAQKDSIKSVGENMNMSLAIGQGLLKNAPDSIKNKSVNKAK
jgi:hypothetical protein